MNNNLTTDDIKASIIAAVLSDEAAVKPKPWRQYRDVYRDVMDMARKLVEVQSLPPGAFPPTTSLCEVCQGDSEERGYFIFVFLDYEKKCLASPDIKRMGDGSVAICDSCRLTTNRLIPETFDRPLRDMPMLINDRNPFLQKIARQRLKNNE